jgi:hypothetical protein
MQADEAFFGIDPLTVVGLGFLSAATARGILDSKLSPDGDEGRSLRIPSHHSVTVYGAVSSPWSQAVMMWMHTRDQPFGCHHFPDPTLIFRFGMVMPVLRHKIEGKDVLHQGTFRILQALDCPCDDEDKWEQQMALLEGLFLDYALTRVSNVKRFFVHWAQSDDVILDSAVGALTHPAVLTAMRSFLAFMRPLNTLYFLALILLGRLVKRVSRGYVFNSAQLLAKLTAIAQPISQGSAFFGGREPSAFDFVLFGHVQAMCCGLSDEAMPVLAEVKNMPQWVDRMVTHIDTRNGRTDGSAEYPSMFARRLKDPTIPPSTAVAPTEESLQRIYWSGLLFFSVYYTHTLLIILLLLLWRYANSERSGRRISRL